MSQDKTLDNTEISKTDIKELEKGQDNKLDNTSSSSNSTTKKSHSKSKSKKSHGGSHSADKSLGHTATVPKDAGNPQLTTLSNIQGKLADPRIQEEIVVNIADLLAQFSKRKLTVPEQADLRNIIQKSVLPQVFKIKTKL